MNLYAEAFDLVGALRRGEKTSDDVALAVVRLADGDVGRARAVLAEAVAGRERYAALSEETRSEPFPWESEIGRSR